MLGISGLTLSSRDTAPANTTLPPDASPWGRLRNWALTTLINRVVLRNATNHVNYLRWTLGLPPLQRGLFDMLSPYLYLHGSTRAFEYPRSDLPPQVHFIGPLLSAPTLDFAPPLWWEDSRSGHPVVHVTQGTVATNANDLLVPTLQALTDEDLLVVATTGGPPVASLGLRPLAQQCPGGTVPSTRSPAATCQPDDYQRWLRRRTGCPGAWCSADCGGGERGEARHCGSGRLEWSRDQSQDWKTHARADS